MGARGVTAGCVGPLLHGCCPQPVPPVNPTDKHASVAVVSGTDLATMTRDALDAFGGAGAIVGQGETVFIKPNFGAFGMVNYNPVAAGDCTKPEIVLSVAEECLKAGASEVIIGDAGQSYSYDWKQVYTLSGPTSMAEGAARLASMYKGRITLAWLNADSPEWLPVPSPYTRLGRIYISNLVSSADRVISLPVIKSHRWTHTSGSLKNFVGITSTLHYGMGIQWRFLLHDAGIEQCFLDIVKAVKPDFTIIDCSVGCEGNGPHVCPGYWGDTVDFKDRLGHWMLLAGTDPVAVDATASRVITHDVSVIPYLQMAYRQGFGQILEDKIELLGACLADVQVEWKPADITKGFLEVIVPGYHLLNDCF